MASDNGDAETQVEQAMVFWRRMKESILIRGCHACVCVWVIFKLLCLVEGGVGWGWNTTGSCQKNVATLRCVCFMTLMF